MFAQRLHHLISENPSDAPSIQRLAGYLNEQERLHGERVYKIRLAPGMLYEILEPHSSVQFADILALLLESGIFERRLSLASRTGTELLVLNDYSSIPLQIFDPNIDNEFEPTPDDVIVLYVPVKNED